MPSAKPTMRGLQRKYLAAIVKKGHEDSGLIDGGGALLLSGMAGWNAANAHPGLAAFALLLAAKHATPIISRQGWNHGDLAQPARFGAVARGWTHAGASLRVVDHAFTLGVVTAVEKLSRSRK